MLEKTLSSGTLNLRFMQNARKTRIEPEHPHVKDDAEWEVSPDIRQSWGPDPYRGEKAVTYETSYLPFLFPSLHDTSAADGSSSLSPSDTLRPRGRRVFNNPASSTDTDQPIKSSRPLSSPKLIFDTGTDRPSPAFLRPAGVDSPAHSSKVKRSRTSGEADEARKKTKLALIE